jgi:RimJ/RimL family protein N-acetyltransferase
VKYEDIVIETERLTLRPPRRGDFDGYAAMYGDEETARYVGGHLPRAGAWRKFLTIAGAWPIQGFSMFSVIERATGEFVGQLGPWFPEGWPGTEVGWVIRRGFWGRGYACEGATAAIDWAFANLGWSEVIHCIDDGNLASQALARRLGSTLRGRITMPPPYEDVLAEGWGQTREAWFARRERTVAPDDRVSLERP